ncbi:MAG: HipA domain-containing protein [Bacteroidota bacterium]
MIAAKLLMPEDSEELALNLNGKKRKLKRNDFNEAMAKAHIPDKAIKNLWNRIQRGMQSWPELIENSFLSKDLKESLVDLIEVRARQTDIDFIR